MKKTFIYLFFIALIPTMANAQEAIVANAQSTNYAYTIGISTGIDHNINAYRLKPTTEGPVKGAAFTAGDNLFNIGFDFGMVINSKLRPRLEFKYVKMNYKVDMSNADVLNFLSSEVYMHNIDLNLRLDYFLYNANKFQILLSPAAKWELNSSREEKNTTIDPSNPYYGNVNWKNYKGIYDENSKNLFGGGVSAIFKYNIIKNVGITVTPEYTLFFRNFVRSNEDLYSRASINVGLEWNIF
ncbi:MAG TPA: hypothetical protein PLR88_04770 [Bacteroidales bacterium]|nr:hypothetical protein [Bacteroidales bacterium]